MDFETYTRGFASLAGGYEAVFNNEAVPMNRTESYESSQSYLTQSSSLPDTIIDQVQYDLRTGPYDDYTHEWENIATTIEFCEISNSDSDFPLYPDETMNLTLPPFQESYIASNLAMQAPTCNPLLDMGYVRTLDMFGTELLDDEGSQPSIIPKHEPGDEVLLEDEIEADAADVADKKYTCDEPGCPKRFKRNADKQRHNSTVHLKEGKYKCDYVHCARHQKPLGRKDHYRDHIRDFHHEDIGGSKDLKGIVKYSDLTWWRCPKCLKRIFIADSGWECNECSLPCDSIRRQLRERPETIHYVKSLSRRNNSASATVPITACNACSGSMWIHTRGNELMSCEQCNSNRGGNICHNCNSLLIYSKTDYNVIRVHCNDCGDSNSVANSESCTSCCGLGHLNIDGDWIACGRCTEVKELKSKGARSSGKRKMVPQDY